MTYESYLPPASGSSASLSSGSCERRDKVPLLRRDPERPRWSTAPRIGIVYSAENWHLIEPLVNDLRYELADNYHFSPINIKITQTECIHDIPVYISHSHQRSEIVFALGVVLRSSPLYEQRLVDVLTQRLSAISVPGRLPVFDYILVRDSGEQLEEQIRSLAESRSEGFAEAWARRAIDTYAMLSKPS
ncbi:hypothetical protein GGI07_002462 [Coemansia sp. Benny D115]|nr:hypothetical protein GGI07_002462 [Coemansia sp. Benny D115]